MQDSIFGYCAVMDWTLLSREGKLKVIEEFKNRSVREDARIFQSCFFNKTPEFYINRIDSIIEHAAKEKIKLKVIEEGIVVMILCIGLAEEIKSLTQEDRKSMLILFKEKLQKEEKFGISFEKCFEEISDIINKEKE